MKGTLERKHRKGNQRRKFDERIFRVWATPHSVSRPTDKFYLPIAADTSASRSRLPKGTNFGVGIERRTQSQSASGRQTSISAIPFLSFFMVTFQSFSTDLPRILHLSILPNHRYHRQRSLPVPLKSLPRRQKYSLD